MSKKNIVKKTSIKPKYVKSPNKSRPTKGWRQISPKLKSERVKLMKKCGSDCFLSPENLRFPICSKKMDCKRRCSGILSAKVRASQWKYTDIAKKADKLWREKC